MSSCLPIRGAEVGFRNEKEKYQLKLQEYTELPEGAEHLRHTCIWPIDMSDARTHISCYFGDDNYSKPGRQQKHYAIDIQVPLNTRVYAPEDATLVMVDAGQENEWRGLADIMLYAPESKLVYWLAHLDFATIHEDIKPQTYFNKWSEVKVKQGQPIAWVGTFFSAAVQEEGIYGLSERIKIPDDIYAVHGRSYDHLHFEVHYAPNIWALASDTRAPLNPIQLLQKLY